MSGEATALRERFEKQWEEAKSGSEDDKDLLAHQAKCITNLINICVVQERQLACYRSRIRQLQKEQSLSQQASFAKSVKSLKQEQKAMTSLLAGYEQELSMLDQALIVERIQRDSVEEHLLKEQTELNKVRKESQAEMHKVKEGHKRKIKTLEAELHHLKQEAMSLRRIASVTPAASALSGELPQAQDPSTPDVDQLIASMQQYEEVVPEPQSQSQSRASTSMSRRSVSRNKRLQREQKAVSEKLQEIALMTSREVVDHENGLIPTGLSEEELFGMKNNDWHKYTSSLFPVSIHKTRKSRPPPTSHSIKQGRRALPLCSRADPRQNSYNSGSQTARAQRRNGAPVRLRSNREMNSFMRATVRSDTSLAEKPAPIGSNTQPNGVNFPDATPAYRAPTPPDLMREEGKLNGKAKSKAKGRSKKPNHDDHEHTYLTVDGKLRSTLEYAVPPPPRTKSKAKAATTVPSKQPEYNQAEYKPPEYSIRTVNPSFGLQPIPNAVYVQERYEDLDRREILGGIGGLSHNPVMDNGRSPRVRTAEEQEKVDLAATVLGL